MDARLAMTFPSAEAAPQRHSLRQFADRSLTLAVRFWFLVMVTGQLVFAFTVASFYASAALRGNLAVWNRFMTRGYIPGDRMGNVVVGVHLLSAVVIILAGTLQLLPQIRRRAPRFHRWNGRLYIVTAFSVSLAGLYMMWIRGSSGDLAAHLGTSVMAVLIMLCAVMALRSALAGDFARHRRWALRLYLVVSASLFIRAGIFLSLLLNHGPFGFDPVTFSGWFLTFMSFAQYLVPLAVLELYLRAQERGGASARLAVAAGLFGLTLALAAGIFAVSVGAWLPEIRKAYDGRTSIASTLSATMASRGLEDAVKQYRELRKEKSSRYNFDQGELNMLGYELLRAKHYAQSIRIFQLNTEVYPRSSNAFDSLGEAYLAAGDRRRAIAHYRRAVALDPHNGSAAAVLRHLNAQAMRDGRDAGGRAR